MNPDFLPKIHVISESFDAPQFGTKRRIAALLPFDYYDTDKAYPVLYLQDGQNLFDDRSPFGNWHVDQRMALLAEQGMGDLIIIAIDHGGEQRIQEFSPPDVTRFGPSFGKQYARFLTETLKPYVDSHFRTQPGRQSTGIGGSSMGALISIYCGFLYPAEYSKIMLFSPSLWVAPKIYFEAINFFNPFQTKIYLYGGGKEGANMVPNIERLKTSLRRKGLDGAKIEFNTSIDSQGHHNEARWSEEFPAAVKWLYF